MKKFFLVAAVSLFSCISAQSYTYQQARYSNDPRVVATFIKANPQHPQVVELKEHLISLVNSGAAAPASSSSAQRSYSSGALSSSGHKQKTVEMLNHIFNSDPSSKDAYVQITNNSKCNVEVRISGRKNYSMMVPARNKNFILVDKGTYTFSSMICDAKYNSTKQVSKDLAITLTR